MSNFVRQFRAVFLFSLAVGLIFLAGSVPTYAQAPHESNIVINEIMFNPNTSTDQDGEWFEVVNISNSDIDIDGWCIEEGSGTHTIDNGGSLIVPANGYLTLGASNDTSQNGVIAHDYVYSSIQLNNSGGETLALYSGACGSTQQDIVAYDDSSPWPGNQSGESIIFCFGSSDNNQGDRWQLSTANDYEAGNFGTPGVENNCNNPTAVDISSHSVSTSSPFSLSTLLSLLGVGAVGVGALNQITD